MGDHMNEERTKRSRGKKQEDKFISTKLLTLQLVCSMVIVLTLFCISRTGGNVAQNIKNFYCDIKKTDMAVSEVISTFKNAAKETFAHASASSKTEETEKTGEVETTSPDVFYEI